MSSLCPSSQCILSTLFSQAWCLAFLRLLLPAANDLISLRKLKPLEEDFCILCVTHPPRWSPFQDLHLPTYLRTLPPPALLTPGGESLTSSLPELQAFLLYWVFFQDYSYQYMIIYFSNIYQENLSFSSFPMTSSVISFTQIAFSTCSHLKYQCSSFLCPKLLYFM